MAPESPELTARKRLAAVVDALAAAHDRLRRQAEVCSAGSELDATDLLQQATTDLMLGHQHDHLDPVAYVMTRIQQLASNSRRNEKRRHQLRNELKDQPLNEVLPQEDTSAPRKIEKQELAQAVRQLVTRLEAMAEARGHQEARMVLMAWQEIAETDDDICKAKAMEVGGLSDKEYRLGRDQILRLVKQAPSSLLAIIADEEGGS